MERSFALKEVEMFFCESMRFFRAPVPCKESMLSSRPIAIFKTLHLLKMYIRRVKTRFDGKYLFNHEK